MSTPLWFALVCAVIAILYGWAYYKSNGKATATPLGMTLWQLPADESLQKRVKFLGYSVDAAGLPTFEYERDGAQFREKIVTEGKTPQTKSEI